MIDDRFDLLSFVYLNFPHNVESADIVSAEQVFDGLAVLNRARLRDVQPAVFGAHNCTVGDLTIEEIVFPNENAISYVCPDRALSDEHVARA